jgi:hypothetical protein
VFGENTGICAKMQDMFKWQRFSKYSMMQNYVSIRKPYTRYSMYRTQTKNLMPEAVPISLSGLSLKIDIKEVA